MPKSLKVHHLLDQAADAKTQKHADSLLAALQAAFEQTNPFRLLSALNPSSDMEGGEGGQRLPFVRVEFVFILSDHYALSLVPEIRDGELAVVVRLDHFKDGQGLGSQSWEPVYDEDVLTGEADESIAKLARRAQDAAIEQHVKLLESCGLSSPVARVAAKKIWKI